MIWISRILQRLWSWVQHSRTVFQPAYSLKFFWKVNGVFRKRPPNRGESKVNFETTRRGNVSWARSRAACLRRVCREHLSFAVLAREKGQKRESGGRGFVLICGHNIWEEPSTEIICPSLGSFATNWCHWNKRLWKLNGWQIGESKRTDNDALQFESQQMV